MSTPANETESWWNNGRGLRCGRIHGRISSGGWRWRIASEGAVWIWLNRGGSGLIWGENDRFVIKPGMYAMTGGGGPGQWSCLRYPGMHALDVIVLSREWLEEHSAKWKSLAREDCREWLEQGAPVAFCGLMGAWEHDLAAALDEASHSGQPGPARLLAGGRILEWAGVRLFRGKAGKTGDSRGASPSREAVRKALGILRHRLDEPLKLSELARQVGLKPHELSRKVAGETGLTLQQHLRRLRVEQACATLDSGRANVSTVAHKVGYQSASHFAKAFREETGNSPREWLAHRRAG